MKLLIPVDLNKSDKANISMIEKKEYWALVETEEMSIKNIDFFTNIDQIGSQIDVIIVINSNENILDFQEMGIEVLTSPLHKSIEDIVEAFLFSELYEYDF